MKCVVLAAGYSESQDSLPKALQVINGEKVIDTVFNDIDSCGIIDEYIIVTNHKFASEYREWLKDKSFSSKVSIVDDGTICKRFSLGEVADMDLAISELKLNDDLMVITSDDMTKFSYNKFIDYFNEKKATCVTRYFEGNMDKIKTMASINFSNSDLITDMMYKPDAPISNWCVPSPYIFSKEDSQKVRSALESGCDKESAGSFVNWLHDKSDVYAMELPRPDMFANNSTSHLDLS